RTQPSQGFVQAFAVYIDTLFVCSATAFIIISTGATGCTRTGPAPARTQPSQGFVQAFAVYIDTLFVCSATAFIIISTG
ncbi:alanine:cation symporter family protein, partial [Corynebacterium diphtheriae]